MTGQHESQNLKAVVLSGGSGTRLRPLTYSVPKQLIPVGDRPVLGHVLADVVACGIEEAIIVTSPESREPVSRMLQRQDYGLDYSIVVQDQPNGLAAAFGLAIPLLEGSSSLLYLGDCLLTGGASHLVQQHVATGADATILVNEVDDPGRYGIVELDEAGRVVALVEKPQFPRSNLAIVGVYAFQPTIAESVRSIAPSARGEYEITDALQHLVDQGGTVRSTALNGWWVDTGTVSDVLAANARLLAEVTDSRSGKVVDSELAGTVVLAERAEVHGSRIVGPVAIGEGALIRNSRIGPSCHVGPGAMLDDVELTNSIVMEDTVLRSLRIRESIIGPRSTLHGNAALQDEIEVLVGSDASLRSVSSQDG